MAQWCTLGQILKISVLFLSDFILHKLAMSMQHRYYSE
jgi:hypothetical protein